MEWHRYDLPIKIWKTNVLSSMMTVRDEYGKHLYLDDGFLSSCIDWFLLGDVKVFKTKQEAKDLIDTLIKNEIETKIKANEQLKREQEFARNNPPEWYP